MHLSVVGLWGTNSGVVGQLNDAGEQEPLAAFWSLLGGNLGYAVILGFICWKIGWL
jgi:Na+-transporting NADH:ubiquinone oxidoreductase subunit NqrD